MSNKLAQALNKAQNITLTENGALTNKSTNSALLDLFSQIGAYRSGKVDPKNRIPQFRNALAEDKLLATKMLFWVRDVRGGQGERNVFRTFLSELTEVYPEIVLRNLHLIPEYGRWDDLFCLKDSIIKNDVVALIKKQLTSDLKTEKPSLLAKWLPSINTSSKETCELAKWLVKKLEISPGTYRKMLSRLRNKIRIVEGIISRNLWEEVNYEHVPSKAGLKYRKAFKKHDDKRYTQYINDVQKGEKKINAATLYPYEIAVNVLTNNVAFDVKTLDAMWSALPDFYNGKEENSLVLCDTSGSMTWVTIGNNSKARPLDVALSLALYIAERNKGIWHNQIMSFDTNPRLVKIQGLNLKDKLLSMFDAGFGGSTDVEAAFMLILNTAIQHKLKQVDMPARIYIVSDMEFNEATVIARNKETTLFRLLQKRFEERGFKMPQLVFWNVAARNIQFPMSLDDRGFLNVSGCNPSILKTLLKGEFTDAYEAMLETLNDKRYAQITI